MISATKTKNTMILEPLERSQLKREMGNASIGGERDEIGSGLQASGGHTSQKTHRMRQTDYSRSFVPGFKDEDATKILDHQMDNMNEPGSPSKVFRSWSRPQINSELPDGSSQANIKAMQVCTCARFRKRIDNPMSLESSAPKAGKRAGSEFKELSSSGRTSALDGHQSQAMRSEMQRNSIHDSDSMVKSPSHMRQNVPRMSQDFKMRILTKKKVAVPPSATSH